MDHILIQRARVARIMESIDRLAAGWAAKEAALRRAEGELVYEYSLQRDQKVALQEAGVEALRVEANWDGSYSVLLEAAAVVLPTQDHLEGFVSKCFWGAATLRDGILQVVFPDTSPPVRPEPHPYW